MKKIELKTFPENCLRKKTVKVEKFSEELKNVAKEMSDIMYINNGIGLASTQVGLDINVITIDAGEGLMVLVNTEILDRSAKMSRMEEGCLSLPGVTVDIARPETVTIRSCGLDGKSFTREFDGIMAKVIQHEFDHLNGKLLIDHVNPLRKFFLSNKLKRGSKC